MGFFDIGEFFNKVSDSARSVVNSVGRAISNAASTVAGKVSTAVAGLEPLATSALSTAKQAVGTLYTDAKDMVFSAPQRLADAASTVIGRGGNAISEIGSSLTILLTVSALGLTAVMFMK